MRPEEFNKELEGIARDALREGIEDTEFPYLGLEDVKRAFSALRQHKEGRGDLFMDTEAPTDVALLLIFAFLVLP